jgi:hypothetical protein
MKKFLTRFLALIMCFSVGFAFVGCDDGSSTETPSSSNQGETQSTETTTANKLVKLNQTYKGEMVEGNESVSVYVRLYDDGTALFLMGDRLLIGKSIKVDEHNYGISLLNDLMSGGHDFSADYSVDATWGGGVDQLMGKLCGLEDSIKLTIDTYDGSIDLSLSESADDVIVEDGVYVEKYKKTAGGITQSRGSSIFIKDGIVYSILDRDGLSTTFDYKYYVLDKYIIMVRTSIWSSYGETYEVLTKTKIADEDAYVSGDRYYTKQKQPSFTLTNSDFASLNYTVNGFYYAKGLGLNGKFITRNFEMSLKLLNDGTVLFKGPGADASAEPESGKWYIVDQQIFVIMDNSAGQIDSFAIGMAVGGEFSKDLLIANPYISFYDADGEVYNVFYIAWTESATAYFDDLLGIER